MFNIKLFNLFKIASIYQLSFFNHIEKEKKRILKFVYNYFTDTDYYDMYLCYINKVIEFSFTNCISL